MVFPSYISANLAFKLHSGRVPTAKLLLQRAHFILCGRRWIVANVRIISSVCLCSQKSQSVKSKNSEWFSENWPNNVCWGSLCSVPSRVFVHVECINGPSGSSRYPGVVSETFICQQSITLGYSAIRYRKFSGMPYGLLRYRATAFSLRRKTRMK